MSVYVAFYKGRPRPGASLRERVKYLFDGAIRVITRSPYSHCELAIPDTTHPGHHPTRHLLLRVGVGARRRCARQIHGAARRPLGFAACL